jgi:hypothetical protein
VARRILIAGLGIFTGVVALIAIDGDPKGALRGYVGAESKALAALHPDRLNDAEYGAAYFSYGDFSALTTDTLRVSATPWVPTAAMIALQEAKGDPGKVSLDLVRSFFRRYGFHVSAEIANWPADLPRPQTDAPLGLNVGEAARWMPPIAVSVANFGCPACHSGAVYHADGTPDDTRVWTGAPNSSINLEGYTQGVYTAMKDFGGDDDRLWQAIDALFPDLGVRERWTLKLVVLPALRTRIQQLEAELGRAVPFSGGLPGATNGLDALKSRLGMIPQGTMVEHSAFSSVPDLGGRLWRTMLLNTGSYAIPGIETAHTTTAGDIDRARTDALAAIVTYFTVPSMGVTSATAAGSIPKAQKLMRWLSTYEAQPFPGRIDADLAGRGRGIYAAACASCHGAVDESLTRPALVSFPNWTGDVGTDRLRIGLFDDAMAKAVNAQYGAYIEARAATGYAAPPLVGLWSSAPYFHNGSIPTLYHLMHPGERPVMFQVGGHALDFSLVGIAGARTDDRTWMYPAGYRPWSESVLVDTRHEGLSNVGHEQPFMGMSEGDKAALLEYLKLL